MRSSAIETKPHDVLAGLRVEKTVFFRVWFGFYERSFVEASHLTQRAR